jgi:O-antigen/teichoic acid export membrane protein
MSRPASLAALSIVCALVFIILSYYFSIGQLHRIDPDISIVVIILLLTTSAISGSSAMLMHFRAPCPLEQKNALDASS